MGIQLDDRRLWGNEAADDEDPAILNSYFVNRPEWDEFFDFQTRLSIARARKGMGKSALLSECAYRFRERGDGLVILLKGADLAAQREFKVLSPMEQVYDWQQRICAIVNRHIGEQIGFAVTDDAIALVETAELSGLKSRNIVGALLDRLRRKIGPVELEKLAIADNKAILNRYLAQDKATVTLLIDDIDATFTDTPIERLRLSTFFTACRELAFNFKGISIRSSVRSDVWASIRRLDEALDKVEQYTFDLRWSETQFSKFLVERITAYCKRIGRSQLVEGRSATQILTLVFPDRYEFNNARVPPHATIRLFAGGRPRWAAQLCRMAGKEAMRIPNVDTIGLANIRTVLEVYGRHRLDDFSREHLHQCDKISNVVNCFSKRQATYTTVELFNFILSSVIGSISLAIDGRSVEDPVQVARFLFRVGFIVGFDTNKGGNRYFQFEDKPSLLQNEANYDDGMKWRVHPSLHSVLQLPRPD